MDLESALAYTVLVNQTAIHAMPEIIRSTSSALLKAATGQKDASISVTNHPLPTLSHEVSIEVSRETGEGFCSHSPAFSHRLLACLCLTLNICLGSSVTTVLLVLQVIGKTGSMYAGFTKSTDCKPHIAQPLETGFMLCNCCHYCIANEAQVWSDFCLTDSRIDGTHSCRTHTALSSLKVLFCELLCRLHATTLD